jgi:hypothetical protein
MKSNSDNYPKIVSLSAGKIQIAYDIIEVERKDMGKEPRKSFNYTYVNIEGELTRAKIINAIIADTYSLDAEIALINNELAKPGSEEFIVYQARRVFAKSVADLVIKNGN